MSYHERAPSDPITAAHPGFYRVPAGLRVEMGDQWVDREGRLRPIALDQVGRLIASDDVVLRADRRRSDP